MIESRYAELELLRKTKPAKSFYSTGDSRDCMAIVTARFLPYQLKNIDRAAQIGRFDNRTEFIRYAVFDFICSGKTIDSKHWNGYRCIRSRNSGKNSLVSTTLRFLPAQIELMDEKVKQLDFDGRAHLIRFAAMRLAKEYLGDAKTGNTMSNLLQDIQTKR